MTTFLFSDRPFAATRRLLAAMAVHLGGCAVGLLGPFARLGDEGEDWSLLADCPVCLPVAQLVGPVAAISAASKAALYLVASSFVLSVAGLLMLFDLRVASVAQAVVTALGAFALAGAPLVFERILPSQLPVHLAWGAWVALFAGLGAFILSASVAIQLSRANNRRDDADSFDPDEAERGWEAGPLRDAASGPAASRPAPFHVSYGSTREGM